MEQTHGLPAAMKTGLRTRHGSGPSIRDAPRGDRCKLKSAPRPQRWSTGDFTFVTLKADRGEYAYPDDARRDTAFEHSGVRQVLRGAELQRHPPTGFPRRSHGNGNSGFPLCSGAVRVRIPRHRVDGDGWHRRRAGLDGRASMRFGQGSGRGRNSWLVPGEGAVALRVDSIRKSHVHGAISRGWNDSSGRGGTDAYLAGIPATEQLLRASERYRARVPRGHRTAVGAIALRGAGFQNRARAGHGGDGQPDIGRWHDP